MVLPVPAGPTTNTSSSVPAIAAATSRCGPERCSGVGIGAAGRGLGARRCAQSNTPASSVRMACVVRARSTADSVTGRPSRRRRTLSGIAADSSMQYSVTMRAASWSMTATSSSASMSRSVGVAAASSRTISADRHDDCLSANAVSASTIICSETAGVMRVGSTTAVIVSTRCSGRTPNVTARARHWSWRRSADKGLGLVGRESTTASRSSRHRSRPVGSRPIVASKRASFSATRSCTCVVRAEYSANNPAGTPAISAMPFSGINQATPSRLVSSARNDAW